MFNNICSASDWGATVPVRTLWHGSSADVSGHAAAFEICGVVAGHDLYLITGEMVQVGDDSRLL